MRRVKIGGVTALLRPFTGYLPASAFGSCVVGPPSLLLTEEQKEATRREPLSFRHAAGRKTHSSHEEASGWLAMVEQKGGLIRTDSAVVVYRQRTHDHAAVGVLANVRLDAYQKGLIKPHERTIARTQKKMTDYMRTTRVYGNPAVLTHRSDDALAMLLAVHTQDIPNVSFTSIDGIQHELWVVAGSDAEVLSSHYAGPLYITDGHHRFAAAAEVALAEKRHDASLPVGLFATDQLSLRSFARCITDPDLDLAGLRHRLRAAFSLREAPSDQGRSKRRGEVAVGIGKRRYLLEFDRENLPGDAYEALDVKLLQSQVLRPVFGIADARKDGRVEFVPDVPGAGDPSFDADVWFLPYPPTIEDVISVADNSLVMPAKSTLFFPKLPSGLMIRHLDLD